MNRIEKFVFSAFTVLFLGSVPLQAAEKLPDGNLLRNPEFRLSEQGKLPFWRVYQNDAAEALVKNTPPEVNFLKLESFAPSKKWKKIGNLLAQSIDRPAAGQYVFGAELSPSRKFRQLVILLMYKGKDGKTVFTGTNLKHTQYPAPGKWIRLVGEAEIPAGIQRVFFCVEIRAEEAGGNVLVKSPFLQWKEE